MLTRSPVLLSSFLALSLCLAPVGVSAESPGSVLVTSSELTLLPSAPYEAAVLTVAGAGGRTRTDFSAGAAITWAPTADDGTPLPDGAYRWELRLLADGGHAAVRRSGRFIVRGGAIELSEGAGTAPELTLASGSPRLDLIDTSASEEDFSLEADGNALTIRDGASTDIVTLESGVLGLFTTTPDPDVELHLVDTAPEIRLEGSAGVWDIEAVTNDLQFVDDDELFPVVVLEIEKTGMAYELVFDGGVIASGDISEGSSRTIKRDLRRPPSEELLEALQELPIYSWSYKTDTAGARHLGPMAEDFHAAFGFGRDDRHISPGDTSGLALLAVQALSERLEQREAEIAELRLRLEALEGSR